MCGPFVEQPHSLKFSSFILLCFVGTTHCCGYRRKNCSSIFVQRVLTDSDSQPASTASCGVCRLRTGPARRRVRSASSISSSSSGVGWGAERATTTRRVRLYVRWRPAGCHELMAREERAHPQHEWPESSKTCGPRRTKKRRARGRHELAYKAM
jgi:hypothetical protein